MAFIMEMAGRSTLLWHAVSLLLGCRRTIKGLARCWMAISSTYINEQGSGRRAKARPVTGHIGSSNIDVCIVLRLELLAERE